MTLVVKVITGLWLLILTLFMIMRGVSTPPGRPDGVDHFLIGLTPFMCALVACGTRERFAVWCLIFFALCGAWVAWNDNTRLALNIAFRGWTSHVIWSVKVTAWLIFAGRGFAGFVWICQDRLGFEKSRVAADLCPACGYDLRASKDRCPECGREVDGRPVPNADLDDTIRSRQEPQT